jgi:ABC-type Fe3+/spermidine/putrescine transport system ATPase subunit
MSLVLRQVRKRFPEFDMEVTLSAGKGELLTLLGPSGCGKTTTLNVVAGFIEPEGGEILVNGREVTRLDPRLRGIGMVFQDYALFPAMDVFGNVAFGLGARGWGRDEAGKRVRELLALVRLERYERRKVTELSGGERQRVALARALAPRPDLLLLDEPLSALDALLRKELRGEIRRIQRDLGVTTVYVTHDQEEALALSDRVAVMREGKVEQAGTPFEIYRRPETPFVAGFVGIGNLVPGRVGARRGRYRALATRHGELESLAHDSLRAGDGAFLLFRPESCVLGRAGDVGVGGRGRARGTGGRFGTPRGGGARGTGGRRGSGPNRIDCTVLRCEYLGEGTLLEVKPEARAAGLPGGLSAARDAAGPGVRSGVLDAAGGVFTAKVPGLVTCKAGERVSLFVPPGDCWLIPVGA